MRVNMKNTSILVTINVHATMTAVFGKIVFLAKQYQYSWSNHHLRGYYAIISSLFYLILHGLLIRSG